VAKRKVEQLACEHGFDSIFIHIPLPRSFCFVAVSHFSMYRTDRSECRQRLQLFNRPCSGFPHQYRHDSRDPDRASNVRRGGM
jgi:hypothetical protein